MAGKYLSLLVHFIWSTKNREPLIERAMREEMYAYIGGIMQKKKAKLLAAGGMFDHIHLYASLPSIISIADFVNAVKANSSRWVHESFRNLRAFAWQEGYGAFSVEQVRRATCDSICPRSGKASCKTNVQRGIHFPAGEARHAI